MPPTNVWTCTIPTEPNPKKKYNGVPTDGKPTEGNKALVLVPPSYDGVKRFPVVLLLHGVGDTYKTWVEKTEVEEFAAASHAIVVMPDGGSGTRAGWYSNWSGADCESSTDSKACPHWETFHTKVLLGWIDEHFATTGRRGVIGVSMGGFGALYYAAKYPKLFQSAASISGFLDTQMFGHRDVGSVDGYGFAILGNPTKQGESMGTPQREVWGDPIVDKENWAAHNPAVFATSGAYDRLLSREAIWLRTGTAMPRTLEKPNAPDQWFEPEPEGYPVELYIWRTNQSFRDKIAATKRPNGFYVETAHPHTWPNHQADLHELLPKVICKIGGPCP